MSTMQRLIVVGVFKNEANAKNALDLLRQVGFSEDQIEIVIPGAGVNTHRLFDDLMNMGLPEEEVSYYQHEFELGRSIVSVKHNGRQLEAFNVLLLSETRIHKYLNLSRSDASTSRFNEHEDQNQASEGSSSSISSFASKTPSSLKVEESIPEEMPSWMRILKDAGFEHLI